MKAEVGHSSASDAEVATREALERSLPISEKAALSLVFTTDAYEPEKVWRSMKAAARGVPFIGFQCGGVLSREGVLERGIGIATLSGDLDVVTELAGGLDQSPLATGQDAGNTLLARGPEEGLAILLPDGFALGLSQVTRGFHSQMGPDYHYIGGASGDSLKFARTCQFNESALAENALACALISGCQVSTAIGHGWQPQGAPLVITRAEGKRVYEIDGRPAFKVYCERLGANIPREEFRSFSMVNPFGFVDMSGQYVIRDPRAVNDDDSLDFVTEVPREAVARLMTGDIEHLVATARTVARRAAHGVQGSELALVFDCISRYMLLQQDYRKELEAIVEGVGAGVPLLGALTFGEIGSFSAAPMFHNKTIAAVVLGNN